MDEDYENAKELCQKSRLLISLSSTNGFILNYFLYYYFTLDCSLQNVLLMAYLPQFCCWSQIIKHAVNFMLLLWRKLNKV